MADKSVSIEELRTLVETPEAVQELVKAFLAFHEDSIYHYRVTGRTYTAKMDKTAVVMKIADGSYILDIPYGNRRIEGVLDPEKGMIVRRIYGGLPDPV